MGLMSKHSNTNEYTFPAFFLATHINSWFASAIYVLFDLSVKLGVYYCIGYKKTHTKTLSKFSEIDSKTAVVFSVSSE